MLILPSLKSSAAGFTALATLLVATSLGGCSTRSRPGSGDGGLGRDVPTIDVGTADTRPEAGGFDAGLPEDSGIPPEVLIYAHSRDTMFTFSPETLVVSTVGMFRLPSGEVVDRVLDLAVNGDGEIFVANDESLLRANPETAALTVVGAFGLGEEESLFALSFLAPGELGDEEVLIGATNAGAYYRIDPTTGDAQLLGMYPDGFSSSGDIVSIRGLGTFATVRRDDFPSDVLVKMNFSPGGSTSVDIRGPIQNGAINYRQLFGLGFWGTKMYAFSNLGELIEVDPDTGAARLATEDTGTEQFWGAGVTTRAPVLL